MMSGQPFLPLYFEEEDHDLWQVLAAIEPENRARLVKAALRQAFLGSIPLAESRLEDSDSSDNRSTNEIGSNDRERSGNEGHKESELDFSIEDLFIPTSAPTTPTLPQALKDRAVPDAVEQIPSCPTAIEQGTAQISPWENLLYNIIGTEDDQEVLTALRNTNLQKERITTS